MKKKQRAVAAWTILILSLPRGIAAFVIAVAGVSIGLSLAVFVVGLPVLAATLIGCGELLLIERRLVTAWRNGEAIPSEWQAREGMAGIAALPGAESLRSWRGWKSVLTNADGYRGLIFGFFQLPVSILAFTLAIVIPAVAFGLLLSPVAQFVSTKLFEFDLFAEEWTRNYLFPNWTDFQHSLFVAGIGAILLLLTPWILRRLGRCYAAWIDFISGHTKSEPVS